MSGFYEKGKMRIESSDRQNRERVEEEENDAWKSYYSYRISLYMHIGCDWMKEKKVEEMRGWTSFEYQRQEEGHGTEETACDVQGGATFWK
jgi:hypothetical protein